MKTAGFFQHAAMTLLLIMVAQGTWAQETTQWTFTYTGAVQTFTVPTTGYYTLECYGAQGGTFTSNRGGYGGTSQLTYQLTQGDVLYIYVGGQGGSIAEYKGLPDGGNGGWNGGGKGGTGVKHRNVESETPWSGGGGGGGATHIATNAIGPITKSTDFTSNHTNLLLIAGGGGGGCSKGEGGNAGGATGEKGFHIDNSYIWSIDWNNGTCSCGKDGMLSSWEDHSCEGCGGGGGGYVGGNTWVVQYNEQHQCYSGAGGSSWGDTTNGTGYTTTAGGATEGGNGKAKITLLFQGSGTSSDPYLISSVDTWNLLADQVAAGNTYSGKYFQLTADIGTAQTPITRMIGVFSSTASDCRPFSGNFDGQGHTLTVDYSSNDHETRTALFSYVKVATIRNLIVAGNCGTAGRAAGIVGESDESDGLNTVTNCVSSVTISGGLVGGIALGGNVDISGCLFNGTINGTSQSGGIVCWGKNVTKITNCLFAPQAGSSIIGGTFYCTDGGAATVTNCYYTTALGTAQGTLATFSSDKPANIGTQTAVYSVSGITAYTNGLYRGSQYICGSPEYNYSLPVTSATVLGESKFVTTFYHGTLDYQLPPGALAYTAGKVDGKVVFYRIGPNSNVIPADTAVIIVADSSGPISLTKLNSTTVTAKDGNILQGSDVEIAKPSETVYVLSVVDSKLGFYPLSGDTIPVGKAYYVE